MLIPSFQEDNRWLAFAKLCTAWLGTRADSGPAVNAVVVQLNAGSSAVDPITLWPLPTEPRRLLLGWSDELTADAIQVRATTVTATLEEILRWHGHQPDVDIQIERAKWALTITEPGVLHCGLNE